MRISPDRALYLSRVIQKKLTGDPKLLARVDVETLRRALAREVAETAKELEQIEESVRAALEKRKGPTRDFDLLYARDLEDALRKHGA
ncbi:MAG TPA: hypothetical protein VG777_00300 [Thermoanaerobaculia bacterium]|nr:hypothetical protein [Thermoanaerobaculia bacterium]